MAEFKNLGAICSKEIVMKTFAFSLVVLFEGLTGIPFVVGGVWLVVYCLKPFIWFLLSTLTLSTITRIDGWYAWYGYWDMLPWFTWNEILVVATISIVVTCTFELIRKSAIFKPLPKIDKPTK